MLALPTFLASGVLCGQNQDQSPWEGPYVWFPADPREHEIEHAAVIGKATELQGRVLLVRTNYAHGQWLWDPAAPGTVQPIGNPAQLLQNNISCGGHAWDADGDLVWAAGDKNGNHMTTCDVEPIWGYLYDPDNVVTPWLPQANMLLPASPPARFGYYYPTNVTFPDGRVGTFGGASAPWRANCGSNVPTLQHADYWQVFDKGAGRWEGPGSGEPFAGLPGGDQLSAYPRMMLLSTGHLFLASQTDGSTDPVSSERWSLSAWLNLSTWPNWQPNAPQWVAQPLANRLRDANNKPVNLLYPTAFQWPYFVGAGGLITGIPGSAATDRTVLIGGNDHQPQTWPPNSNPPPAPPTVPTPTHRATHSAVWSIDDPIQPASAWTIPVGFGSLNRARMFANVVITPDLKAIVFGGSQEFFDPYGDHEIDATPVYEPEILDLLNPLAGWQLLVSHTSPRLYHSSSLLLKDGRILCVGGYKTTTNQFPALSHTDAEIFTPPNLMASLARPSITSGAPLSLPYNGVPFTVTVALQGSTTPSQDIEFATLIRCGSSTHHFNSDQRVIQLAVTARPSSTQVTLAGLPASQGRFIAPPGYYYLFLVTTLRGTPPTVRVTSVAEFVKVG